MMNITISTEAFDIISSGSVIIPANDYVEFKIENLRFRFNMVQNDDKASAGTFRSSIENDDKGQCMVITLVNFSSSFFATPNQALRLAHLNGRALYLKFSITSINRSEEGSDCLFFYSWMLSKHEVFNQNNESDVTERK